jgi:hypothetical protein
MEWSFGGLQQVATKYALFGVQGKATWESRGRILSLCFKVIDKIVAAHTLEGALSGGGQMRCRWSGPWHVLW